MYKRLAQLALPFLVMVLAAMPREAGAQTVRRLKDKDVSALVGELRTRLAIPDTATTAKPATVRVSDQDYNELTAAAVLAMHDLADPTALSALESCVTDWGTRDQGGLQMRHEAQTRRANMEIFVKFAATLSPLLEKFSQANSPT